MTSTKTRPGSRVVRGPMADDHYTKIHNLAVRGAIPTRYVGVFGYISSHQEGWTLTAASVATALDVGVDFVTAALQAIEKAGCLIRDRLRDASGKLGGSVWFVTDLPLQLRQLGIDEELIAAKVRDAYEQWRAAQLDDGDQADDEAGAAPAGDPPNRENPILDVTSANAAAAADPPSSAPNPGFPDLAEPGLADPVHKKNNNQEDHGVREDQEENPPVRTSLTTAPARGEAVTGGDLDQEIRDKLNGAVAAAVDARTGSAGWSTSEVAAAVRRCLGDGHDVDLVVETLAQLAADRTGTRYPGRLPEYLAVNAARAASADAEPGPAWVEGPFRYLDRDAQRCRRHPGHPAKGCGLCRADQLAADDVAGEPAEPMTAADARELARRAAGGRATRAA